jgi:glycerol-3-phosphate cytidylyltransferase
MNKKQVIVFTGGTWDMLHIGHLNVLQKAKQMGTVLIVGVSTDQLVKKYKGSRPVVPYAQRFKLVSALKYVDKVVKQKKLFDLKQFKKVKANIFVVGDDWRGQEYKVPNLKWLKDNNYLRYVRYTKGMSTSLLKERIIKDSYNIIRSQCASCNKDKGKNA